MIYDCVTFFNEIDLLELRFTELNDVVDRFVVVEAPITFSGDIKPLLFSENTQRFDQWKERIIHVVVEDMPGGSDPWIRENFQRDAIARGLAGAKPWDEIIISDCDEVPHPEAIRSWDPSSGPCCFNQLFSYYWINCIKGEWKGSRISRFDQMEQIGGANSLRMHQYPAIPNGGWHFSFLGGPEAIRAKIEAYSHQELNISEFKTESYLQQVTSIGIDLFGRRDTPSRFVPLDGRFPRTVLSQREKYSQFIREARFHEEWYDEKLLLKVCRLLASLNGMKGSVIEIGCWEGRSTIALAHTCYPDPLLAIDTWTGSMDESPDHVTVALARERDVWTQFWCNVELLTKGNVNPIKIDCHEFLHSWRGPIKFIHIDASHDFRSVKRTIEAVLPWLVPGGIVCGSDFENASTQRNDLDGGVERAVRELLPGFIQKGNLWYWKRRE
jgi:beta-1,4-mannosyl-glycoprotein beta-1,4-N-acetylglucosaminyltransferase